MAQQVRRAAALTAELAVQFVKKVSVVCDKPQGLRGQLAEHTGASQRGRWLTPQATVVEDPWATSRRPSASESQATTSVPPESDFRPRRRVPQSSRVNSDDTTIAREHEVRGVAAKNVQRQ